jgi:hypothetical protein
MMMIKPNCSTIRHLTPMMKADADSPVSIKLLAFFRTQAAPQRRSEIAVVDDRP